MSRTTKTMTSGSSSRAGSSRRETRYRNQRLHAAGPGSDRLADRRADRGWSGRSGLGPVRRGPQAPPAGPLMDRASSTEHKFSQSYRALVEGRSMFRAVGRLILFALLISAVTCATRLRARRWPRRRRRRRRWWQARRRRWCARGGGGRRWRPAVAAVGGASREPVDQRTARGRWGGWCPARWRSPARRRRWRRWPARRRAWAGSREQAVDPARKLVAGARSAWC